jgi:hypothetical protein
MSNRLMQRCGLVLAAAVGLLPLCAARPDDAPGAPNIYRGQVVPLDKVLATQGVKLDADAAPAWLALKTDDGKVHPLVKDAGARMFFKDARLLNRPMRLTGRLVPGTPLLQVVAVHSEIKGRVHDLYYWCDICSIRSHDPGICDCCGRPVELREEPLSAK